MWGPNHNRNHNYSDPWLYYGGPGWLWDCGYVGPWLQRAVTTFTTVTDTVITDIAGYTFSSCDDRNKTIYLSEVVAKAFDKAIWVTK